MDTLKIPVLITLLSLIVACSHPIEIVGEGDVLSATGTRNCYYEDFLAGAESCTRNLVVHEYIETYYAVPRDGWKFEKWLNYSHCTTISECAFDIPADLVHSSWGQTMPPLVAVFTETAPPPPEPVAVYSYALDAAGGLLNPQPLEGAHLQRKTVYFSFLGDYSKISFWCCKVPEGDEPHMPRITDDTKPFVLRVDMGALADDGGLERELYADIFDSEGNYKGYFANWTLEPKPTSPIVIEAGVYTIDYTVDVEVVVLHPATLNIVEGAKLQKINARGGVNINISGGQVESLDYCESVTYNVSGGEVGSIDEVCMGRGNKGTISGGKVGSIAFEYSNLLISDGTVGSLFIWGGLIEITGGLVDSISLALQNDAVSMRISGGEIVGDLSYRDMNLAIYTFYGSNLTLTEPEPIIENYSYESVISGTLRDGTAISKKIICEVFISLPPACVGVRIVNEP
jgi:hypothetical protein